MVDRRVRRTRQALIDAYNSMIMSGRRGQIKVREIAQAAGVGRSTVYDHYSSVESLHLDALRGPFRLLADAVTGAADTAALSRLLQHFWDYRERGRQSFGPSAERLLAEMIDERLGDRSLTIPRALAARQLAAAAIAPIAAWVRAEAWCSAEDLAAALCASGRAQLYAMMADPVT